MRELLSPIGFRLARYEFVFEVKEKLILPRYKGATLRGCFGKSFQQLACPWPERCLSAPAEECECPYGAIFAPRLPKGESQVRAGEEVARPFAICPPLEQRQEYLPGDNLRFILTLFGRACQELPWFLVTFRELPPIGIPPHRGRLHLKEVLARDDIRRVRGLIYTAEEPTVRSLDLSISSEEIWDSSKTAQRVLLRFESPLYLRYLGQDGLRRIEFAPLVSRLLQRIETIAELYGEPTWRPAGWADWARSLIQAAKEVAIVEERVEWFSWKRFSAKQERRIPLEGVVGETVYEGELTPFLPLLGLGQFMQVGKGCVFGQGVYQVVICK